jgi:hypothetical protein
MIEVRLPLLGDANFNNPPETSGVQDDVSLSVSPNDLNRPQKSHLLISIMIYIIIIKEHR